MLRSILLATLLIAGSCGITVNGKEKEKDEQRERELVMLAILITQQKPACEGIHDPTEKLACLLQNIPVPNVPPPLANLPGI